jgi:hypothetical protein
MTVEDWASRWIATYLLRNGIRLPTKLWVERVIYNELLACVDKPQKPSPYWVLFIGGIAVFPRPSPYASPN